MNSFIHIETAPSQAQEAWVHRPQMVIMCLGGPTTSDVSRYVTRDSLHLLASNHTTNGFCVKDILTVSLNF